jgi:glycosyltransferase involved in cell wall biosynthesis
MLDARMPVAILMPIYNTSATLPAALRQTLGSLRDGAEQARGITVFLVDDGSERPVEPEDLPSPTAAFRIVLARHATNLGQGAALETARQLALGLQLRGPSPDDFAAYVTMDSDGQHRAEDAFALVRAIDSGADVAFGNRFLGDSNVPIVRRAVLGAARFLERELTGLRLGDAHNGLRAFSRGALERVPIRQNRMAHATEIKQRVSRAGPLAIVEVPVSVRYTEETLAKGQRSLGALVILRDLLQHYFFGEQE